MRIKFSRRFFITFSIFECLALLGVIFQFVSVFTFWLFFPAYVVTITICCGDYASKSLLIIFLSITAWLYAVIVEKAFGLSGA